MTTTIEKESGEQPKLKTEGPLTEKDQQGQAAERQRRLEEQALANWRRLKEKVKGSFKK
jgi:hypothetical protein